MRRAQGTPGADNRQWIDVQCNCEDHGIHHHPDDQRETTTLVLKMMMLRRREAIRGFQIEESSCTSATPRCVWVVASRLVVVQTALLVYAGYVHSPNIERARIWQPA